jgi:predicted phage terminase large subunit-like protein
MEDEWLLARCREVQESPDEMLDLWARGHYKSSIITFGLTIQDILRDPEVTVGIFSCTRPIAKQFVRQIKREFEGNEVLRELFSDILWENPQRDAPKWSEDDGIIVRRKGNPKESTVEAWGVVEGQPTSKHFKRCIYDDLITVEYVSNPEMIEKVTDAWALSLNLGSGDCKRRYIGTRYHFGDTYKVMMDRGAVKARIYPATDDGTLEGAPVFLSKEALDKKRAAMGQFVFSAQMLQNPIADTTQGFSKDDIRYYDSISDERGLNKYILVDPANDKKKKSDWTAAWVVGLAEDGNYYILDVVRDKLNLSERGRMVIDLHKRWSRNGRIMGVGYEMYSMQADIQYIEELQARENYRFHITPLGGKLSKVDRIKRLIPLFEQHKIYFPNVCYKTNYEGKAVDLIGQFIQEEFLCFPVPLHDDMLDALARITEADLNCIFPDIVIKKKDRWVIDNKIVPFRRGSVWTM